jgi:hypothetical protein
MHSDQNSAILSQPPPSDALIERECARRVFWALWLIKKTTALYTEISVALTFNHLMIPLPVDETSFEAADLCQISGIRVFSSYGLEYLTNKTEKSTCTCLCKTNPPQNLASSLESRFSSSGSSLESRGWMVSYWVSKRNRY